jgi:hypothetical protein
MAPSRLAAHPGLLPVVLSGLAVGTLQVSLYHLILPFVGADVYAFLMSTGLFFLGYSLTALVGERLAGRLHLIEIASGCFFLLLAGAQVLFVEAIYDFDSHYGLRRTGGILVFLVAGLLQGPILAAYPRRVAERFLRVYEIESLSVCVGALLAGLLFYLATPLLGVSTGGAFALAAGILLCTPAVRSLYGASRSASPTAGRSISFTPQIGLFLAGVFAGSIQYSLQVMGQMWLTQRWLIPSVVIAACVASISLASRTSRVIHEGQVARYLPFFFSPLLALLLLALGAWPFYGWGMLSGVLPYARLAATSFCAFLLLSSVFPRIVEDRSQRYGASLALNAIGFLLGILLTTQIDHPVQRALPVLIEASCVFAIAFWLSRIPKKALALPMLVAFPLTLVFAYSLHPQYGRGALGYPIVTHSWSKGLHTTFIGGAHGHELFDNGSARLVLPSEFEHLSGRLLDRLAPPGLGLVIGTGTGGSAAGLAVSGREVIGAEINKSVERFLRSGYRQRFLPFPADFSLVMRDGLQVYSERDSWAAVLIAGIPDETYYGLGSFYSWPFVASAARRLGKEGILGYLIDGRQGIYIPAFIRLLEGSFRYFKYVPFLDSYGALYCSNRPFEGRPQLAPREPKRLERYYHQILHVSYAPEEIARKALDELSFDWSRGDSIIGDSIEEEFDFDPWDVGTFIRTLPMTFARPRSWFDIPSKSFREAMRARSTTHLYFESVYHPAHQKRMEQFRSFRAMKSRLMGPRNSPRMKPREDDAAR